MNKKVYILAILLSLSYGECIITGCSNQICAEEPTSTDCAYLDWFVCFQNSECGDYSPDGSCSWLLTAGFLSCLDQFGVYVGCTDPEACNYNPEAAIYDGSCEYYNPEIMCDCEGSFLDINGDCCSELMMDVCWVCDGDGPAENYDCNGNCLLELDCAGNCCAIGEEGCYWQETGPCGEPGPSNGMDACGVCGGDNSSCADCSGVPCSNAYLDNCGVCDDDPLNDCVQGCDGEWGSGEELDECDVCGGDGSLCTDTDGDGCTDDMDDAPYEWDDDYDSDGVPDDCDADDDNDGAADASDSDDNNEYVCSDIDGDTCDDCLNGYFDPTNDGPDRNENGICDQGDAENDIDDDGVIDDEDYDPFDPYVCFDYDGDTCDDCSTGFYDPANDGEDYDADGLCNLGDDDDDNDGVIDSEDCAPLYELAAEIDCCGVCGGDNSSCSNCCGIPFGDDCSSACDIDEMGECCMIEDMDTCGLCYGDNGCIGCEAPFVNVGGHCLHADDIAVLQQFIDNSLNSGFSTEGCDSNDPWCSSPNLYMDQSDNWHEVIIDGQYYQFSNDNGIVEPLELGLQQWTDGRLTNLMCGAYIYCQLSGEIPSSISDLIAINILRLEVNYFSGLVPESICGFSNLNYDDNLAFDLSYNQLCPPYPECVPDGAVNYMNTSECWLNGDVNYDAVINVLDVVALVNAILNGIDLDGGDLNNDNTINVIDVVMLVNMILNGS